MTREPRDRPRACVIGAGSSGIAATKALHEAGIEVDCFERTDRVGGLWVFRGTPETARGYPKTAAYRSLHINTNRNVMAYSDYPMPAAWPDFPSAAQMYAYYDAYADHFGIRERIRFGATVAEVRPAADGVQCELTLLRSSYRKTSQIGGEAYPGDPYGDTLHRFSTAAAKALVTSTADNDPGLFEVSLKDEMLLPFEGSGAVSQWKIEIDPRTNRFPMHRISDCLLYTSDAADE